LAPPNPAGTAKAVDIVAVIENSSVGALTGAAIGTGD
jgi:hypothetical protein